MMAEFDLKFVSDMAAAKALSTQAKRDKGEAVAWAGLRDRLTVVVPPPVDPPPVDPPPVVVPPPAGYGTPLRPFSADSPWNTPAPSALEATSGPMTQAMRRDPTGATGINVATYSEPVYVATLADPMVTIHDTVHNVTVHARVPSAAVPAAGNDSNMTIIQPDGTTVDMWIAKWTTPGTALDCDRVAVTSLTGKGIGPMLSTPGGMIPAGTRAAGCSLLGGLIRKHEVDPADPNYTDGVIRHALAMSLPGSRFLHTTGNSGYGSDGYGTALGYDRRVATEQDWGSEYVYKGPIPLGRRFVIPKTVNINSLGLNPQVKAMAKAAQDYGVIPVDKADNDDAWAMFYAEPACASAPWAQQWWADDSISVLRRNLVAVI